MIVPRYEHTATLLVDGQVVAAGGCAISRCPTDTSETYNPQSGAWTAAGKMQSPRLGHTQTSLPSGQALVVGGCGFEGKCRNSFATAELFDPQSRTWTPAGQLQTGRYDHAAALLGNGTVLVTGGFSCVGGSCAVTATAEIYNPVTNSWTSTTSMTTPRVGHTMNLFSGGLVLVTGGCTAAGCATALGAEVYDPQTQTWTPTAPMILNRTGATATLLASGQVLVAGGKVGGQATAAAELFNPQNRIWTATGSMTTLRTHQFATRLGNGTVLVACGIPKSDENPSTADVYNPASGQWAPPGSPSTNQSTLTELSYNSVLASGGTTQTEGTVGTSLLYTSGPAPLVVYSPTSIDFGSQQVAVPSAPQAATLSNLGTLPLHTGVPQFSGAAASDYAVSGSCIDATVAVGASCTYSIVFTPTTDGGRDASMAISDDAPTSPQTVTLSGFGYTDTPHHWIPAGTTNVALANPVSRLPNGNVLAVGGTDATSAEIYDATANSWSPAPSMFASHEGGTATNLANGTVLMAGGGNNVAEIYNPQNNRWLLTGPMTETRQGAAASLLPSGQVLVTGGCYCTSTEIYNPETNAWTPAADLLAVLTGQTSTLLKTGLVLIAGGGDLSAELYDPVQNTFTYTGSTATDYQFHTASLLANGDVLIAGGLLYLQIQASAEIYSPSTGLWTLTGSMNVPRESHTATVLATGAILVAGGYYLYQESYGVLFDTNSAEVYDPVTGVWTVTGSMASERAGQGAVLLKSGAVLVAGGDEYTSTAEQYIP
jgi:N-acetylneuraminic acid mutarotase